MADRLLFSLTGPLVKWARTLTPFHEGDLVALMVLGAAYRALGRSARETDEARRGVSIYSVAVALGQPRETIRRKVKALAERKLLSITDKGVLIPTPMVDRENILQALAASRDVTRELCTALTALGLTPPIPDQIRRLDYPTDLAALDFYLGLLEETSRRTGGDVVAGLVFCAIGSANMRSADADADLFARLPAPGGASSPRPITALALAEALSMPRETTRRYVSKLLQAGRCQTVRGGLIAVNDPASAASAAADRRIAGAAETLVAAVIAADAASVGRTLG